MLEPIVSVVIGYRVQPSNAQLGLAPLPETHRFRTAALFKTIAQLFQLATGQPLFNPGRSAAAQIDVLVHAKGNVLILFFINLNSKTKFITIDK